MNIQNILFTLIMLSLFSCENKKSEQLTIESGQLILSINENMETQVQNKIEGTAPLMANFKETEYLTLRKGIIGNFRLDQTDKVEEDGTITHTLIGTNADGVQKVVTLTISKEFPDFAGMQVVYHNKGQKTFDVQQWVNHDYTISPTGDMPPFWSFQGSSNALREDWIQAIDTVFYKKNYMGMNNSDYGGGIPVVDIWRKDKGIAIGHTEMVPKLVSIPLEKGRDEVDAHISVTYDFPETETFKPGHSITTLTTFVSVHTGDCFASLRQFSAVMQSKGIEFAKSPDSAFDPMWCAWGYERNFTLEEVIGTLPKVKELGIKWATLDDGYQITEGDWTTNKEKFPNGAKDMRRLTKAIHDAGLKAQIWWAPLAVSPDSKLLAEHPNVMLRTAEWTPQFITWWDAWYMAPTDKDVLQHTKDVVTMFIKEWDFDGLKMDGQHLNAVLPDHSHDLEYPEQACEQLPDFFQSIYETATSIKEDALLQHCPCGTCMSFYNMPATNQTVSSDPLSSLQIRQKGKVYKAIIPDVAYFGDHVELSDNGTDFASSFGIGAVLGTKFTWPKPNPTVEGDGYLLTPEKEVIWKHWFDLYNEKMLSKAAYLGDLYDIGYDKPETHLIEKDGILYYAFYAKAWEGDITFKGLDVAKSYTVKDYFNEKELGEVDGKNPVLSIDFEGFLLVEVVGK